MNINELVGKKEKVKIIGITNNKKYFVAQSYENENNIFIEDTGDFELDELVGSKQECLIIDIKQNQLIGFIVSSRKFINDINKIKKQLEKSGEIAKVTDIYLMERLKIKGKVAGLYMVDEGEIGKYYLETKEIGQFNKKIKENNILYKQKTVEEELAKQIKDVVQSIDLNKKEISLNEEIRKQTNAINEAIGMERQITRIATLDLKQKSYQKNERTKDKKIQPIKNIGPIVEEKKQSSIRDVNIKQELEMNDKVTDMKTLGQLLESNNKLPQMQGKKFVKMGVIESDSKDNLVNKEGIKAKADTTRYSFVAIASDGTVVPMDLNKDHAEGNNPREVNYQVTQSGRVEQDDVLSRFNIGEGTFAVKNGKYGEIKVYHSPRKTIGGKDLEGNKSLDRELETDNVWIMKKEERDLSAEYKTGYRSVERGYKEAKEHEDKSGKILEDDNLEISDVDGDKNTKSHTHDDVNYELLASKWGYYIDGNPNSKKAEELFEEKRKEYPNKEEKEIVEMITEDLEEQIRNNPKER